MCLVVGQRWNPFFRSRRRLQYAARGFAGGLERASLSCPIRMRMADVAGAFPALADRLLVASSAGPASDVQDHPRYRPDDRPCSGRPRSRTQRGGDRQPDRKAPAAHGTRGYAGAKRTVGRKRHIAVDAEGRLLMVDLTTADISDSAGSTTSSMSRIFGIGSSAVGYMSSHRRLWRLEAVTNRSGNDRSQVMTAAGRGSPAHAR